jgi:hypothetical protein
MSTLKVTNIQATGETASRAVSGVAAAWIHYNGSSATIAESVNVASATDNGTGDYTANYTNDMSSSTYVVVNFVAGGDDRRAAHSARDELVAGSWNLISRSAVVADSNALVDENKVMGAVFGDYA